jgi:hypothetical protein
MNDRRKEGESASTAATEQNMEDGGAESSDTAAAAHLREPAIVQMAELGLPRQWAELALSQVGGTNTEAAGISVLREGPTWSVYLPRRLSIGDLCYSYPVGGEDLALCEWVQPI